MSGDQRAGYRSFGYPAVAFCVHESKGKVCGLSITQGVLDPTRWTHTARMFDFAINRKPEPHQARPE